MYAQCGECRFMIRLAVSLCAKPIMYLICIAVSTRAGAYICCTLRCIYLLHSASRGVLDVVERVHSIGGLIPTSAGHHPQRHATTSHLH